MNTKSIPIARMLASFADVYGPGSLYRVSDHTSRMENKQIGMNWIKASVNWHYAMGINNMTSYYNFENFKESEVRNLNQYTARLGYLIRQGKRMSPGGAAVSGVLYLGHLYPLHRGYGP